MNKFFSRVLFSIVALVSLTNTQCEENDDIVNDCDKWVIVDGDYYNNLESANFSFISIGIDEDCLSIDMSSSGCDGNSWDYKLVDSGAVAESFPEQRYLKFELINNEICQAVFTKNVTFNLEPIRIEGSNEIILHIEGYEETLTYSN